MPRCSFGATISVAIAHFFVFCNSVSVDGSGAAASRFLGDVAVCVLLLSFAIGQVSVAAACRAEKS